GRSRRRQVEQLSCAKICPENAAPPSVTERPVEDVVSEDRIAGWPLAGRVHLRRRPLLRRLQSLRLEPAVPSFGPCLSLLGEIPAWLRSLPMQAGARLVSQPPNLRPEYAG